MKTCPVCKTQVFDDMQSCFGCMHRFDDDATFGDAVATPGEERWRIEPRPQRTRGEREGELDGRAGLDGPSDNPTAVARREWSATPIRPDTVEIPRADIPNMRVGSGPGIGVRLEVRVATDPAQVWSAELYPTTWPSPSSTPS